MKNQIATGILFLASLCGAGTVEAQPHTAYVISDDLTAGSIMPGTVYELLGRKRQHKPTWGSVEVNGEQIHKGNISLLKRGSTTSLYQVGDTSVKVTLLNEHYAMEDGILKNVVRRKHKKVECLIMEPDRCDCTAETGIIFGKDSITTNTTTPYKMVVRADSADMLWLHDGIRTTPAIRAFAVDSLDDAKDVSYVLTMTTTDGAICDMIDLDRDEYELETKFDIYKVSLREDGLRFIHTPLGYTIDGRLITEFQVSKMVKPQSKGVKRQKHSKQTRK